MSAAVELIGVCVDYGSHRALERVDLDVQAGELVTLLGPSGAGKSTALNAIGGFVPLAAGDVRVAGESIARLPAHRRDIGIVFQSLALFGHMTVGENVGFPLRARRVPRHERRRLVQSALELVRLDGYAARKPGALSGGEQQRVALARAIVFEPRVLLLDEPFAALDRQLRESLQTELKRLQRSLAITTIAVTHDQAEAMALSDRIAIMRAGRIEQLATPADVYAAPATRFVAEFVGEANLLPLDHPLIAAAARSLGGAAALLRPEQLVLDPSANGHARATVRETSFHGERWRLVLELDGRRLIASRPRTEPPLTAGQPVSINITGEIHILPP